jgi:cobalt/nickel transport system ATP-binding protein
VNSPRPHPLIDVRDLYYRYADGTTALNGVDFRLDPGESVAVLGPNGSGKTTFVLHLNGLLTGNGSVEICGLRPHKQNLPAIRRKVGLVFQDSDNQLFMPTVIEDVAFGLRTMGMSAVESARKAEAALHAVGIAALAHRAPYHLSAGEKKRAAIAGVLAMEPEILVFDEPTTFLDPPAQRSLALLLTHLSQSKVVITHNIPFAAAICNKAVFFDQGQIAAQGPIQEIAGRFGWEFRVEQNKMAL